ncbi:MAG: Rrf2 family transcriptional regulator [Anaerolineae bacterium]|nr:Rrf2 family transcriptional regulator [Anaerolineae bacterium]
MRLSTLGRYALRAMVDVALHGGEGPVQRREIAERQEISGHYLAQLLAKLRRAGLVQSMLGPGGGYVLARPASEISAGDVLRAVEESLSPVYCVDSNQEGVCQREDGCPTRVLWARLGKAVSEVLDATTLAELCTAPGSPAETRSKPERKGTSA